MTAQKVGILGSGDVAQALGKGFAKYGWDVKLGSRSPEKLDKWVAGTDGAVSAGSFADAAAHGDVVVLALLGEGTEAALDLAGPERFAGKLVLDATNPLDFAGDMPHLFVGGTDSLGERVQRKLPDALVVKCFNTVPNPQMVDPRFDEGSPSMLICGNDADAKARTEAILTQLGWPGTLDLGDITTARYLEAVVPMWARAGMVLGTWTHAVNVIR